MDDEWKNRSVVSRHTPFLNWIRSKISANALGFPKVGRLLSDILTTPLSTMSLIRPQLRARLLPTPGNLYLQRTAGKPRWQGQTAASTHEHQSGPPTPNTSRSDPPGGPKGDSEMIRQEDAEAALIGHQPDYHAPIDHGTTYDHSSG